MKDLKCCHTGCEKEATKHIQYDGTSEGIADFESYTHSCNLHEKELSEGLNSAESFDLKERMDKEIA